MLSLYFMGMVMPRHFLHDNEVRSQYYLRDGTVPSWYFLELHYAFLHKDDTDIGAGAGESGPDEFGWWMTILGMVGDRPGYCG